MQLTEILVVALTFSIALTLIGSTMLAVQAMEIGLRETMVHTDLASDLPAILEPWMLCALPEVVHRNENIVDFFLEPCLEIARIMMESRTRFRIFLSQPEFRTVLAPYERHEDRWMELTLAFENGCSGTVESFYSDIEIVISIQRECRPSPGQARPLRGKGIIPALRLQKSKRGLWLRMGFVLNDAFQPIPYLESFYPGITGFNWTYRFYNRRFMLQEPGEAFLRWDLDGNDNRRLDANDEPVFRPFPLDEADGFVFFFKRKASTPSPERIRCGTQLIKQGEKYRCIVVTVQKPV